MKIESILLINTAAVIVTVLFTIPFLISSERLDTGKTLNNWLVWFTVYCFAVLVWTPVLSKTGWDRYAKLSELGNSPAVTAALLVLTTGAALPVFKWIYNITWKDSLVFSGVYLAAQVLGALFIILAIKEVAFSFVRVDFVFGCAGAASLLFPIVSLYFGKWGEWREVFGQPAIPLAVWLSSAVLWTAFSLLLPIFYSLLVFLSFLGGIAGAVLFLILFNRWVIKAVLLEWVGIKPDHRDIISLILILVNLPNALWFLAFLSQGWH